MPANSIPRRTLDELVFLYELDPGRRDVYVEGPFDAGILRWFLKSGGLDPVVVYEIESVEVPLEELSRVGLQANNRSRIVFLARTIDERLGNQAKQVTCWIDADFDYLTGQSSGYPELIYTDFTCMEMYLFYPSILGKFLTIFCNREQWPAEAILESLANVLQELFLVRLAGVKLGWQLVPLNNLVGVTVDGWSVNLNADLYCQRLLSKNAKLTAKAAFLAKVDELRSGLTAETRYQMHGHDFTELLTWYLRAKGVRTQSISASNISRLLATALEYSVLANFPSFQKLRDRCQG